MVLLAVQSVISCAERHGWPLLMSLVAAMAAFESAHIVTLSP